MAKVVKMRIMSEDSTLYLPAHMAELKTKATKASPSEFLKAVADPQVRKDCQTIAKLMEDATNSKAKMWGSAIIGFGERHLVYDSGRELDWMIMGFAPRKANIAL